MDKSIKTKLKAAAAAPRPKKKKPEDLRPAGPRQGASCERACVYVCFSRAVQGHCTRRVRCHIFTPVEPRQGDASAVHGCQVHGSANFPWRPPPHAG